jgi:hypothetical protein
MTAILEIIRLSLELAVLMVRDMTPEQRQAFWIRHEERMAVWHGLLPKAGSLTDLNGVKLEE